MEKVSWETLIKSLSINVEELKKYTLFLTPEKAYDLLNDAVKSEEFLRLLIELETLHSVVLGMHPVSLYGKESYETKTVSNIQIYNKALDTAERLDKMIGLTLKIYGEIKSQANTTFLSTKTYCYNLMIKDFKGCGWSFYGLLLQIINLCSGLINLFKYLEEYEKKKGELWHPRRIGELEKYKEVIEAEKEISKIARKKPEMI